MVYRSPVQFSSVRSSPTQCFRYNNVLLIVAYAEVCTVPEHPDICSYPVARRGPGQA